MTEALTDESAASKDAENQINPEVLQNISVTLSIEVGRAMIKIKDLMRLTQGSVVELDRIAGEPLDLLINNTVVAQGEVVLVTGAVDWLRFSASFLLVLVLLAGMLWLLRRMKSLQVRHSGPALLEVRETIHVSPRQKVALLRVGHKHVLVGISAQQLTALGEIDLEPVSQGHASET
jgi:flagellar motor switch protein FliN